MKEAYVKPKLHLESFALSQSIAATCGYHSGNLGNANHGDSSSCGLDMGNLIVWVSEPVCNYPVSADSDFSGVCYNAPNGGQSLFGS